MVKGIPGFTCGVCAATARSRLYLARAAGQSSLVEDLDGLVVGARTLANPATPMRERKRLIRLLVTDVTLLRDDVQKTFEEKVPAGSVLTG